MVDAGMQRFNEAVRLLLALSKHDITDARKFAQAQVTAAENTPVRNEEQKTKLLNAAEKNLAIVEAVAEVHRVATEAIASKEAKKAVAVTAGGGDDEEDDPDA